MKKVNNNINKFLNNKSILFQEINEINSVGNEIVKGIKIDSEILKNINTSPRTQKEKNDFMKAAEDNLSKMYERMIDTKTQEEIKEFYKQISKFNRYTISNINLAAFQGMLRNIEVSMLSSYKQFQEMGASVKKGQTALMIKKYEETYEMEVDENGRGKKDARGNYIYKKDENGNKIKKGHTYIPVPVFDVSQTNAVELGLIKRLDYRNKDADISKELLDELVKESSEKYELKIKFDDLFNEKLGGYYSPITKEIVINTKNRTNGQMLSTLFHELGHYKLHTDLDYTEIHNNKGLIEGEAESVSFILSYKCGVENKSELYIAGWGNDIEGIKESQKKILKASQEINRELDVERLLEVDNQRMKEKMFEECSECFNKLNNTKYNNNEEIINDIGEKNFNKFVDENNFFNIVEAKEYFFNNSSEENFSKKLVFDKLVELYNLNTNDNEEIENDYRKENIVIFIKNSVNEEFYNRLTKDNVINFEVAEYYLDRKITDKFYNFMDENKPKEYFIDVLKINGLFLQKVPEELKNDYDIVMTAVSQNGSSLQFSSDEMKKNYDIVSKSIEKDGWNIEFANNKFYFEKDIIKKAVSNNGMILEKCLSESIKDVEIVYLATKNNEFAYNFASYTVKEKYGNTPEEFIDNYEKEIIQRNFTDNNSIKIKDDKKEVSNETLIKLNDKNKELLKESAITKEDNKLSSIKSNSKDSDNSKDSKEVKTSNHKQKQTKTTK